MSWWTKHRTAVIGGAIGLATGGVGTAAYLGAAGVLGGQAADNAGGISNLLFGKQQGLQDPNVAPLPSRNEVVMNVLNEQLATIKKRQQQPALGTGMAGDSTSPLASTTLFGV